ncbi:hypothetical protein RCL1_003199 [Eukaryota sp. TZLM3-RCL]
MGESQDRMLLFEDILSNEDLSIVIDEYSPAIRSSTVVNFVKSNQLRTIVVSENLCREFESTKEEIFHYLNNETLKIILDQTNNLSELKRIHVLDVVSIIKKMETEVRHECVQYYKQLSTLSNESISFMPSLLNT